MPLEQDRSRVPPDCFGVGATRGRSFFMEQTMSECIEWKHAKSKKTGYGVAWHNGKWMLAHRAAWEKAYGKIPQGIFVCHRCDNRICVNPKHLFLGTAKDNAADRDRKNRTATAERNAASKLNWRKVRIIRSSSLTNLKLAKKFGVHHSTIWKARKSWSWKNEAR